MLASAMNPATVPTVAVQAAVAAPKVFTSYATKPTPAKTGSGIALAFSNRRPKKMNKFN